jgi:hypothetical protein
MGVPKATMDEDNGLEAGKDEIGRTREPFIVHAITNANPVESATKMHFRSRVVLPDTGHYPRAGLAIDGVHSRDFQESWIHGRAEIAISRATHWLHVNLSLILLA